MFITGIKERVSVKIPVINYDSVSEVFIATSTSSIVQSLSFVWLPWLCNCPDLCSSSWAWA